MLDLRPLNNYQKLLTGFSLFPLLFYMMFKNSSQDTFPKPHSSLEIEISDQFITVCTCLCVCVCMNVSKLESERIFCFLKWSFMPIFEDSIYSQMLFKSNFQTFDLRLYSPGDGDSHR